MKRYLCVLAVLALLLGLSGCGEGEDLVYPEPVFTPGTMESERLSVEKGNFDRANRTGSGMFLEIKTGYYYSETGFLLYAEKTDAEHWYYVCSNPDCTHGGSGSIKQCSAQVAGGEVVWKHDKLYTTYNIEGLSQYSQGGALRGLALLAMEKSGENIELIHFSEAQQLDLGGSVAMYLFPDTSYILHICAFNADGSYTERLILVDKDRQERSLFERTTNEQPRPSLDVAGRNYYYYGINGDICFQATSVTDGMGYSEPLCWFNEGELTVTDIAGLPAKDGYLSGGILRGFASGDGYYDTNLLTGEKVRLADAQLSDSGARILQPNCIIESTLLNPKNTAQTQQMRFFDGESWHDVELPEELRSASDPTFEVLALTTDKVIFRTVYNANGRTYVYPASTVTLYEMPLGGDYSVSFMGTFQLPREE